MKKETLKNHIDWLLGRGELLFSKTTVKSTLGLSEDSFRGSVKRLVADGNILRLSHGWYLIVPLEYRSQGFVPPELFIDDYMSGLGMKYYVCLLSAASFHGATHQAIQKFQVMVSKPTKRIDFKGASIEFYVNKDIETASIQEFKTDRGPLIVSSVEATAFDLMKYMRQSGNLDHIATILGELSDKIDRRRLSTKLAEMPLLSIQRLGYLLELLGKDSLSRVLSSYLEKQRRPKFYSPLNPSKQASGGHKSRRWHLIINEQIEADI